MEVASRIDGASVAGMSISSDSPRGPWAIPPALLVAQVIGLVEIVVKVVFYGTGGRPWDSQRFFLTVHGLSLAASVLGIYGMFELTRRSTGRVARGTMIATAGLALVLVVDVAWSATVFDPEAWTKEWVFTALRNGYFVASSVVVIGLAYANTDRPVLALAVLVLGIAADPPPVVHDKLWGSVHSPSWFAAQYAVLAVRAVIVLVACFACARGETAATPQLATAGFRTAARALWLRVIAAGSVIMVPVMLLSTGSRDTMDVIKFATVAGATVNVLALAWFALGALQAARSAIPGGPRYTLVMSASLTAWAAGVSVAQLPYLYRLHYNRPDWLDESDVITSLQALTVVQPMAVLGGIALVATAIAAIAARRGAEHLREQASSRGVATLLLLLGSMAIQQWLLPTLMERESSLGLFASLSIIAVTAALFATATMAGLCGNAAAELEREGSLPTASVVRS